MQLPLGEEGKWAWPEGAPELVFVPKYALCICIIGTGLKAIITLVYFILEMVVSAEERQECGLLS